MTLLATYHEIIETQAEMLSENLVPQPKGGPTLSLLSGLSWHYDTQLDSFGVAVGALLSFPRLWKVQLGVGVMTTFPPSDSLLFAQIAIVP